MNLIDLFEELKEKFPTCLFTSKGRRIVVHSESTIDGVSVYNFTAFRFPYKAGLHFKLSDYLEAKGWYAEPKNEELIIKQF